MITEISTETQINVGDLVIATPDGGSFVSAYVYAIEDSMIIFQAQRGGCLFDCPRDLAEMVTILIAKFEDSPKAQLISEILSLVGAA